jgi:hypothetical protein
LRVAGGMSGSVILGWDMTAALQLGAALGLSPLILAELLPPIEAVMVRKINETSQAEAGLI